MGSIMIRKTWTQRQKKFSLAGDYSFLLPKMSDPSGSTSWVSKYINPKTLPLERIRANICGALAM